MTAGDTDFNDRLATQVALYFEGTDIRPTADGQRLAWQAANPEWARAIAETINLVARSHQQRCTLAWAGTPLHECNKIYSPGDNDDGEKPDWVFLDIATLKRYGPDFANIVFASIQRRRQNISSAQYVATYVKQQGAWEALLDKPPEIRIAPAPPLAVIAEVPPEEEKPMAPPTEESQATIRAAIQKLFPRAQVNISDDYRYLTLRFEDPGEAQTVLKSINIAATLKGAGPVAFRGKPEQMLARENGAQDAANWVSVDVDPLLHRAGEDTRPIITVLTHAAAIIPRLANKDRTKPIEPVAVADIGAKRPRGRTRNTPRTDEPPSR